jgi:protein TonB
MERQIFDLKERMVIYFKWALFFSLVLHIVGFVAIPEMKPRPYKPKALEVTRLEELPEQMKEIVEPKEIPKPKIPVEAETEEEVEEATIEATTFTGFEKVPPPPEVETPEFVPYDTPPQPINLVKPVYPDIARKAGLEGVVFVRVLIDTTGAVLDARVAKSVHEALDQAALIAARKSTFVPAKQRDKPVKVWVGYPFRFSLEED